MGKDEGSFYYWLGASDLCKEGDWYWMNSKQPVADDIWYSGNAYITSFFSFSVSFPYIDCRRTE